MFFLMEPIHQIVHLIVLVNDVLLIGFQQFDISFWGGLKSDDFHDTPTNAFRPPQPMMRLQDLYQEFGLSTWHDIQT